MWVEGRQVSIHPNCATLYGTCRPAGKKGMWIVMEAATGSVRDVLVTRTTTTLLSRLDSN
jgi:hypothetical protein